MCLKIIFRHYQVCLDHVFYGRCPEGTGRHNVKMPPIGQKWECNIVEEVIDVDELDEGYLISAAAGKQGN